MQERQVFLDEIFEVVCDLEEFGRLEQVEVAPLVLVQYFREDKPSQLLIFHM